MQAQLLGSSQKAAKVLLPVQVHPELLEGPRHALRGMQRFAARHIGRASEHLALDRGQPGFLLNMAGTASVISTVFSLREALENPLWTASCMHSPLVGFSQILSESRSAL